MKLRSLIAWPIKFFLALVGYELISDERYGHNALLDIDRLGKVWNRPVGTFFDVGANDGATIRLVREKFKDCRIVSFEPHPNTFKSLSENTKNQQNIELINIALGSVSGQRTMYEYDASVLNSLIPNAQFAVRFKKDAKEIQVNCITIDRFCAERDINRIDVLKIDTEGNDFDVLKGAASMLEKGAVQFIYIEFNEIHSRNNASGGVLAPIDNFLRPYGYRFLASYNDYVVTEGEMFIVSNALYVLPPKQAQAT